MSAYHTPKLDRALASALKQALESHEVKMAARTLFASATKEAVLNTKQKSGGDELTSRLKSLRKREEEELKRMNRLMNSKLESAWRRTTKAILSAWEQMWQGLVAGWQGDKFVALVLETLARIASAFGQMLVLTGIALQAVPLFGGLSGARAIAAGLALIAFAGMLKGATSLISGGSEPVSSVAHATGGGYSASTAASLAAPVGEERSGGQTVYNITIDASGAIDTAESIAKKLEAVIKRGKEMGYAY